MSPRLGEWSWKTSTPEPHERIGEAISCWCVSYQCQKQSHTAIQIDILRGFFCGRPARKARKKKEFVAVCHERAKSKVPSLRQVNSKPVWIRTSLNQSYKGLTACNFNPKPSVNPGVTAGCSLSPPGYGYRPNKVYGARGACFAMWSCTSRRPLRKTIFAAGLTRLDLFYSQKHMLSWVLRD